MFIQTEDTPNPETLKFVPGNIVLKTGTADFSSKEVSLNSPLASRLFEIDGVKRGIWLYETIIFWCFWMA